MTLADSLSPRYKTERPRWSGGGTVSFQPGNRVVRSKGCLHLPFSAPSDAAQGGRAS